MANCFFLEGVSQKIPISKIRYAFEKVFDPDHIRDIICHLHNQGDYVTVMDVSVHVIQSSEKSKEFYQELFDRGFVSMKIGTQEYKVHVNAWTSFPVVKGKYVDAETYESMRYPSLYIERVIDTDWHIQQLLCYLFVHPSNVYSTRFLPNGDGTFALFIHPKQNMPGTPRIRKMYKQIEEKGWIPFDFESHKARLPLKDRHALDDGNFIYTYRVILASDAPLRHMEKIKGFRKTSKGRPLCKPCALMKDSQ
jgi:hypothetical protein